MSTPTTYLTDPDSEEWWDALQRNEFLLQECGNCAQVRWPPRPLCRHCMALEWTWTKASGLGSVASWTVTRHAAAGVLVPFVVVLVRLDDRDDILVPGFIDGPSDGVGLVIGSPVSIEFDRPELAGERGGALQWKLQ